jgi:hypothetical protein
MDTPVSSQHNCQQIRGRGRGVARKVENFIEKSPFSTPNYIKFSTVSINLETKDEY